MSDLPEVVTAHGAMHVRDGIAGWTLKGEKVGAIKAAWLNIIADRDRRIAELEAENALLREALAETADAEFHEGFLVGQEQAGQRVADWEAAARLEGAGDQHE